MVHYLCGDVGGTNSRLQLFELLENGTAQQRAKRVFPSKSYSHLSVIIKEFLAEVCLPNGETPLAACLAVAGPVKNNTWYARVFQVIFSLDFSCVQEWTACCQSHTDFSVLNVFLSRTGYAQSP